MTPLSFPMPSSITLLLALAWGCAGYYAGDYNRNNAWLAKQVVAERQERENLQAALARGKAVMVGVNSETIWSAVPDVGPNTPNYFDSNHMLVVIAVDLKTGKVYLNDSGPDANQGDPETQGMEVPIGAFMNGWAGDYKLYVVDKR